MNVSDLTPNALAELETKLIADLEMVRKVRILLEEHRSMAGSGKTPATPPTRQTPGAQLETAKPLFEPRRASRPIEEIALEGLAGMADRTFSPDDFRQIVKKATGQYPESQWVRGFLSRMVRQNKAVVHEFRKGRRGCLYRSLLPPPTPAEDTPPPSMDQPE